MAVALVDTSTLSLAIGLSNCAFAVLATVYNGSIGSKNEPLSIWRWARLISGIGFFLIWLRPVIPLWMSMSISHLLLIVAWALEYSAYAHLLTRCDRHLLLILCTASAIIVQLILHISGVTRRLDLIYFSLVNSSFFTAMAILLLMQRPSGVLVRLMGITNGIGGLLFLARIVPLSMSDNLANPSYQLIHTALFTVGYLILVVNGYGFLLLAKQQDDRALHEALRDVAQAESEQRQLLSMAAHEFRTPAALIRASLDSLKFLRYDFPPQVALRLHNMRQATQRLVHIANTLITQDRLKELRFGLLLREVDVQQVVDQALAHYVVPLLRQRLDLPHYMSLDPELITIAVHNLVDNALRHSSADQAPEISLQLLEHTLEIAVADHGSGISAAEKEVIFERFYRRGAGAGSGLGLPIVRTIAQLHGGTVIVRDRMPQGAIFVIQLPLRCKSADAHC